MQNKSPLLLVEDSVTNQKVALLLVQKLGLNAEIASNGHEAVEAIKSKRYSLILMDCLMPDMDGFEATHLIRKHEIDLAIYTPIVAVTALAMPGDRERCLSAGMDDYISKPIEKELFNSKIRHWLQPESVARHQRAVQDKLKPHQQSRTVEHDYLVELGEISGFYGNAAAVEVMNNFFRNTESRLRQIKNYIEAADGSAIAGLAHEMKVSSATVGAHSLERLCLWLQRAAIMADWLEARAALSTIEAMLERLKSYFPNKAISGQ